MTKDDLDAAPPRSRALSPLAKYGILTLVIALLFIALMTQQVLGTRRIAREAALINQENLALVLESTLSAEFDLAQHAVTATAADVPPDAMTAAAVDRFWPTVTFALKSRLQDLSSASALRLFDAEGRRLYSSRSGDPVTDIGDQPFFRRLEAAPIGAFSFSPAKQGPVPGQPTVMLARAVRDLHGTFLGAAVLSLDLSVLGDRLRQIDLGPSGVVELLRLEDGAPVVRIPEWTETGTAALDDPILEAIQSKGPDGHLDMTSQRDGIERMYAYRTVGIYPFCLAIGVAHADYLAEWRQTALRSLGASLLFLLAMGLIFYRLAQAESRRDNTLALLSASRESLAESWNLLRSIIDTAPIRVFWKDRASRYLGCNPAFAADAGMPTPDAVIGCSDEQLAWRAEAQRYRTDDLAVMDSGTPKLFYEEPQITANGQGAWMRASKSPLRGPTGEIIGVVGLYENITERKQQEAGLRLAASVFANSYEGIIITDPDNVIIDVNPALSRITGFSRDEIIGQTPKVLSSGRQSPEFYARMWTSLTERDFWQGEIWNRRKSGEVYAEVLAISAVRDTDGRLQHYIAIFSDISHIKSHEAELDRIAHYDPLTGVANRRLFTERLDQAIVAARHSGKPLAVCYLDLDGFKPVNDRHGHAAGDRLLVSVTERLKGVLRSADTLARIGGDEFVLLFSQFTQLDEINGILHRVLRSLSAPFHIESTRVVVSASIGVTLFPADDADADTLLRHADQAMYRAKEAGKNRYHLFDPDHDRQVRAYHHHQQVLRDALDGGQFVLHYQPKVDLVSGAVVGAEALLRWQHPNRGLLPPGEFLHHLTDSDLDVALGEWVIDQVLGQIAAWDEIGLPITLSANVSARHLLEPSFADRLRAALDRHPGLPPHRLELEILESAALADMKQAVQVLSRCSEFGVSFALDDFGTGYSSLSYFRSLPIQLLKIDQSFVRGMLDNPNDLGIVESVVRLAHAFDRPVIAEGVETLAHGAMLIRLGCRLAQGYGIARPMPAQDLPAWIATWHRKAPWRNLAEGRVVAAR